MEKSQVKWLYISVGFSLLVLVIILYFTINENTVYYLRQINPVFLFLAFMTHILTTVSYTHLTLPTNREV